MEKKTHKIVSIIFMIFGIMTGIAYIILMFKSLDGSFVGLSLLIALLSCTIISNQERILAKLSD